jgi:hypothetical protein
MPAARSSARWGGASLTVVEEKEVRENEGFGVSDESERGVENRLLDDAPALRRGGCRAGGGP